MPRLLPPVWHPIFVHVPLVLFPLAALLATVAIRRPWAVRPAHLVFWLAVAGTGAAVAAGAWDFGPLEDRLGGAAGRLAGLHETTGYAILWLAGACAAFWLLHRGRIMASAPRLWAAMLWGLAALVAVAGWMGGALVYEYGVHMPA